jgi:hypothetical protein
MALPWLGLIDTLIDVTNLVLTKKSSRPSDGPDPPASARRIELEREQAEREQLRADRLLKLELLRQAGDREIGRLRLMAGLAVVSWIGTLFFSTRLAGGPMGARVMLGAGWLLLLAALSLSFTAQARVGRALARIDQPAAHHDDVTAGTAGAVVPGLIVMGLAVIGLALLMA